MRNPMRQLRRRFTPGDPGSAMVITLMVLAVLASLGTTLAAVTTTNLQGTGRASQAANALNLSDAAVSQAVTYLRTEGVRDLRCSPTCGGNPWGNSTTPQKVVIDAATGKAYTAWIETIAGYPATSPGLYRIHATGIAGGGPAVRNVTVDVQLTPFNTPQGVFAGSVSAGGTGNISSTSLFTTGCVYKRSHLSFSGMDTVFGIPAAAHSSQYITESQGSGQFCAPGGVHGPGAAACNLTVPNDQDKAGGPLAGTACQGIGGAYPQTSLIASDADLFKMYNLQNGALTAPQLATLKSQAQAQQNYYTSAAGWPSPTEKNAVMFFDLLQSNPGGSVDLNGITGFDTPPATPADSPGCPTRSLTIVIVGGNAKLNAASTLNANVFLTSADPYGNVSKANGSANFIGNMYANSIDIKGTATISMDGCFLSNPAPSLFDARTFNYTEIDR